MHIYVQAYMHIYVLTCMHTYVKTCTHIYGQAYMRLYVQPTCIYTYIRICLHTYRRTCIDTDIRSCKVFRFSKNAERSAPTAMNENRPYSRLKLLKMPAENFGVEGGRFDFVLRSHSWSTYLFAFSFYVFCFLAQLQQRF